MPAAPDDVAFAALGAEQPRLPLRTPTTTPSPLPIVGGGAVAPRRVWCVGRNYADHAREMGADPAREPPFFFAKPTDALCWRPRRLPTPPLTADLQHEVELALVIGRGGVALSAAEAEAAIGYCAVAIDLTRRDLQAEAKAKGRPWEIAKAFDLSAPIGSLVAWPGSTAAAMWAIRLEVDGQLRQQARIGDQLWAPAEVVAQLSRQVALAPGDVILCGTPAGVGRLPPGCAVYAAIEGLPPLALTIDAAGAAPQGPTTPAAVLAFWFAHPERWFASDAAFDAALRERFADDAAAALRGELDHWAADAAGRLALVLLLDQLPRNLYRGDARAFASDAAARGQARAALRRGDDRQLDVAGRAFLYLPFEHAEDPADTALAVELYRRLRAEAPPSQHGFADTLVTYAERHHRVVARFGRYPHRNAALGRASSDDERAFLAETPWGF